MDSLRQQVAKLAAAFYRRELAYIEFFQALPADIDYNVDDDVTELLDLIEHEPVRGRLFGLPPAEHDAYLADIQRRIAELAAPSEERDKAI